MFHCFCGTIPVGNYMSKVNNGSTRKTCEICSKLIIKTPKRRRCDVFIISFEDISHLALVFCIDNFEQVNAGWDSAHDFS